MWPNPQKTCYKFSFPFAQLATSLFYSCLKIGMESSPRLQFYDYFWARNNNKYLEIDIYINHTSTVLFQTSDNII